jgi:hypothetical protein
MDIVAPLPPINSFPYHTGLGAVKQPSVRDMPPPPNQPLPLLLLPAMTMPLTLMSLSNHSSHHSLYVGHLISRSVSPLLSS